MAHFKDTVVLQYCRWKRNIVKLLLKLEKVPNVRWGDKYLKTLPNNMHIMDNSILMIEKWYKINNL